MKNIKRILGNRLLLSAVFMALFVFLVSPLSSIALTYSELQGPQASLNMQKPAILGVVSFPSGSLVNDQGTVWYIYGTNKIPFTSSVAFKGLGYSFNNVVKGDTTGLNPVNSYVLNSSAMAHPWGSFVSYKGTVYYSSVDGLIGVPSSEVFINNGGAWKRIVKANSADIAILAQSPNLPLLAINDSRTSGSSNIADSQQTPTDLSFNTPIVDTTPASANPTTTPQLFAAAWQLNGANIDYTLGNVGIGTQNPTKTLDVTGTINATQYCINGSNCISSWPTSTAGGTVTSNGGAMSTIETPNTSSNVWMKLIKTGIVTHTIAGGAGYNSPDLVFSNDGATPGNYIFNSGNVGIGTTIPKANLQVYGPGAQILVQTSSNVNPALNFYNNSSAFKASVGYNVSADTAYLGYGGAASSININPNGNVGIGTNAPSAKLEVKGTTYSTYLNGFGVNEDTYIRAGKSSGVVYIQDSNVGNTVINSNGGNVGIGLANPTHLLTLSGGAYSDGATWSNASDRNLKTNFTTVDPQTVLAKIANLPITQWNYKSEDASIKHIGPTAQDFSAAFGLNGKSGETSVSTIDPSGVALLGIQALNQKVESQKNGFEMKDVVTGKTYCVQIANGDFVKTQGQCK